MSETASRPRKRVPRQVGPCARLTVIFPLEQATSVDLGREPLTVGRQGCALTLAVPSVSKQHLVLEWDEGARAHAAIDQASKHGTVLDGVELEARTVLSHQAVLRLGEAVLVYELLPAGAVKTVETAALPGRAQVMHRLRDDVARAGREATTALIVGPTGVGKEALAAELHRLSGRKGPFLAVNAGALAVQLAESQLFGHVKGAYTGADGAGQGFFRAANGGTLFLDEIGELSGELQPKLLRALQQREVIPVGATTPVKVELLVVAATNRELSLEVERGTFRRDLYARLALWELQVPPLSERRVDIVEWVRRLQAKWAKERGKECPAFALDAEAVEALVRAPLSENLRALDRLVHQLGEAREVSVEQLPAWLFAVSAGVTSGPPKAPGRRASPGKEELLATLERLGSVRATAKHFERDRKQIYRWIEAYGLDWKEAEARD